MGDEPVHDAPAQPRRLPGADCDGVAARPRPRHADPSGRFPSRARRMGYDGISWDYLGVNGQLPSAIARPGRSSLNSSLTVRRLKEWLKDRRWLEDQAGASARELHGNRAACDRPDATPGMVCERPQATRDSSRVGADVGRRASAHRWHGLLARVCKRTLASDHRWCGARDSRFGQLRKHATELGPESRNTPDARELSRTGKLPS